MATKDNDGALVQRYIRTKMGNIVLRRVRPDNPNIVADRDVPNTKAKAPKADKVAPAEPKPEDYNWTVVGHAGCCGGRVLIRGQLKNAKEQVITEEEGLALYEKSQDKVTLDNQKRQYEGYISGFTEALTYLQKNGRNMPDYVGYRATDLEMYIRQYKNTLENFDRGAYSFSAFKARGYKSYGQGLCSIVDPSAKLQGVTVSEHEFPGATKTPAGLWVRSDYPVPNNATPFIPKDPAADLSDIKFSKKLVKGYWYDGRPNTASGKLSDTHRFLTGMSAAPLGLALWLTIKKDKPKAGTVYTCILNRNQQSKVNVDRMAAAGWTCTLICGNATHPGSSILYLYERRVTAEDLAYLETADCE